MIKTAVAETLINVARVRTWPGQPPVGSTPRSEAWIFLLGLCLTALPGSDLRQPDRVHER